MNAEYEFNTAALAKLSSCDDGRDYEYESLRVVTKCERVRVIYV